MAIIWQTVRGWFARVGSDPYYASFDRSLGNIKAELDRLQAARLARAKAWAAVRARFWRSFAAAYAVILAVAAYVNRQPPGTYTHREQALRVAPAFLAPLVAWLAHRLLGWLQGLLDRRSAARARVLEAKLRKQVAELKDSTRYQRTLALLQKYDPDYAPPTPQPVPLAGGPNGLKQGTAAAGAAGSAGLPARAAGAAVNVAGSALQGAGTRVFPLLAQLYSRAANSIIADDPVMLNLLRDAQKESDQLRQRLEFAEARAVALLQANIALKQQLGLPTEEEQAALAAWTGVDSGGSGGGSSGGAAAVVGEGECAAQAALPAGATAAAEEQGGEGAEGTEQPEGEAAAAGAEGADWTEAAPAPEADADQAPTEEPAAAAEVGGPAEASSVARRKRGGRGA